MERMELFGENGGQTAQMAEVPQEDLYMLPGSVDESEIELIDENSGDESEAR